MNKMHGTTIVAVRKSGSVTIAGDWQVSLGNTVIKSSAQKIRSIKNEDFEVKRIYKIDDGRTIVVESRPRGNTIWQVNKQSSKLERIADIWNFIDLAQSCERIPENNIYFAHNLEYWFNGGTNIDYQTIRIFSLNNPKPYNDNYLGITPSMNYAKEWCTFYKPYNIKEK